MRSWWWRRENSFLELVKTLGEQGRIFVGQVMGRRGRGGGSCELLLGLAGTDEDVAVGIPKRRQGCWCLAAPALPWEG